MTAFTTSPLVDRPVRRDLLTLAEMGFAIFGVMFMTTGLHRLIQGHSALDAANQESPLVQLTGALIYLACGVLIGLRYTTFLPLLARSWVIAPPIVLAFASTQWSVLPDETFRRSIALLGTALFGLYLGGRFRLRELSLILFGSLALLVAGSFLAAVVTPRFGVHQANEGVMEHHAGLWRGLFGHKNRLGPVASISLFVTLALWRLLTIPALVKIGICVLSLIVILKAGSAQAMGQAVLFSTAIILHNQFSKFPMSGRFFILLFLGAFAPFLFVYSGELMAFGLELLGRSPTVSGRTNIWSATMIGGMQRPILGAGYTVGWRGGTDLIALQMNHNDPGHAHNGFLTMWLDMGFVGIAAMIPFWILFLKRTFKVMEVEYRFYIFSLYFFIFYVTTNIVESNLFKYQDIYVIFLIAFLAANDRIMRARAVTKFTEATSPFRTLSFAGQ